MQKLIGCPICHKLIGKMEENGEMKKVYLWCRRCKKELYLEDATKYIKDVKEI